MTLWAVVPVKSLDAGKSRLAGALTRSERRALNEALLLHTLRVTGAFPGAGQTLVVSADAEVLARAQASGVATLQESPAIGLNGALRAATAHLRGCGAGELLIVPSDLPLVQVEDLETMARFGHAGRLVIAADRHGEGTNALWLSAPAQIEFCFGAGSLARHREQASRCGLDCLQVVRAGLAFDVDTPEDLLQLRALESNTLASTDRSGQYA